MKEWDETRKLSTIADITTTDQLFRLLRKNKKIDAFVEEVKLTDEEKALMFEDPKQEVTNWIATKKAKKKYDSVPAEYQQGEYDITHLDNSLLEGKITKAEYITVLKELNRTEWENKLNLKNLVDSFDKWKVSKIINIFNLEDFDKVVAFFAISDEESKSDKNRFTLLSYVGEKEMLTFLDWIEENSIKDFFTKMEVDFIAILLSKEHIQGFMKFWNNSKIANTDKIIFINQLWKPNNTHLVNACAMLNDKKYSDKLIKTVRKYAKKQKIGILVYLLKGKMIKNKKSKRLPSWYENINHLRLGNVPRISK